MVNLISLNNNPAQRLLAPFVRCKIGNDVFESGDGVLMQASVSLGEGEKSSKCSFQIYDPLQYWANKYMQASYADGGLTALEGSSKAIARAASKTGATALGTLSPERRAILDTIAWANGGEYDSQSNNRTFSSYQDHPRGQTRGGEAIAAGRYRLSSQDWDANRQSDFTPQNQDRAANALVEGTGAIANLESGNVSAALTQLAVKWPALPPGPDATKTTEQAEDFYQARLRYYKTAGEQRDGASQSAQAGPETEAPPTEQGNKGGQISIWLGYSPDQLVEFAFLHQGTKFKGFAPSTTTFEGQSVRWLMTRRVKNATYQNVTLRQLAEKVAQGYGLTLEMEGDGPKFEFLDQTGLTDYQLLHRECEAIGYRIYDNGPALVVEPRTNKPLGFVLEYGVNMLDFEVSDSAQSDTSGGETASEPQAASTTGELKTVIDPLSGAIATARKENTGAAGNSALKSVTGTAVASIKSKTDGKTKASDTARREAANRVKGFPGSAKFTATPASLTLNPDTPFVTAGLQADFLNRAWVIEQVDHNYQNGSLLTTVKFYAPMAPKPGSGAAGSADLGAAGECNRKLYDAAIAMQGFSTSAGPGGGNVACVWSLNRVFERAGLSNPWGNSNSVDSVDSALSGGAGTLVDEGAALPGDIVVWRGPRGRHVGIVLESGATKVISNSSSRARFSWIASNNAVEGYYGGTSKIFRLKC